MIERRRRTTTRTSRSVDRLINFSDAVVAVAITVLVLPLVDIPGPRPGQTVLTVLSDNSGQIVAFLFTFYVVTVMWLVHNRILNSLERYDSAVIWLNITWLALIVLMPWFSAMYGESAGGQDGPGVGMLYWGAMAAISFAVSLIDRHLHRHPELLTEDAPPASRKGRLRGAIFTVYFLVIGLVSVPWPAISVWLPFGIIPLSIWFRDDRRDDQMQEDQA